MLLLNCMDVKKTMVNKLMINDLIEKTLHILFIIDELKIKGGTEKHLYELATGMANAGYRVTVFAMADGDYAQEFKNDSRINYNCLDLTRIYDVKGIASIVKIAKYICNKQVDILQTFHTASDLVGPLAARLSFHNVRVFSSRRDLGYTKLNRHVVLQRYVNGFVDGILANSQSVKMSVVAREGVPEEQVTVINNGINIDPFVVNETLRQQQRLALGALPDSVLIGSVGNIRPVKGYDLLVEAAGIVCQEMSNVIFYHVGEGELKDQLEVRCRELGIEHNFRFLGATKDVPAFLRALDIYVQPSRSEGFSNAILEAMAARLPVLATNVGGNPDLIEHEVTGLLVPADDRYQLSEQLNKLAKFPNIRNCLAERAYKLVNEKFRLSTMLNNYVEYYGKSMFR